jgi:hypothetical protein
MTPNLLFICGSLNQTTQMHQISKQMGDYNCFFTPFYADGIEDFAARRGWMNSSILGGRHLKDTKAYLADHNLSVDYRGERRPYDLVVTCSDLIVPKNIRRKRLILVQEGITVPEGPAFHLVRTMKFLPRYLANTAATGLSDNYDLFCVASEGYRELFIRKGVRPEKIAVTGIPNFDHLIENLENTFPFRGYVLVATTPHREGMHYEDRPAFLRQCVQIADGRPLIFKLHPLENVERANREISRVAPDAMVLTDGNVNHMIANAESVITQKSTCTYVALALEKEVYTQLDLDELHRLMPIQNKGDSSRRIASLCHRILHTPMPVLETLRMVSRNRAKSPAWARRLPKGRWEIPNP